MPFPSYKSWAENALTYIMKEVFKDVTKKKKRKQARAHVEHGCSLKVVSALLQETVLYSFFSLHTRIFFSNQDNTKILLA